MRSNTTLVLADAVNSLDFRSILQAWGTWCRQGLDHLGYSKVHYLISTHSERCFLNEDELAIVDSAVAGMTPQCVKLLKARYIQRMTYRDMCKAFCFGSTATVGKRLEGAEQEFAIRIIHALGDALDQGSKARMYESVVEAWMD